MSRVGKVPVPVPVGVDVKIEGKTLTAKGPKGELSRTFSELMAIEQRDGSVVVTRKNDDKEARSLHGLTRSLIKNMVVGVSEGYQRSLDIVGVGYRATQQGQEVQLQVGLSHLVEVRPLPGIQLEVEGQTRIHVRGPEKEIVGLQAAKIRKVRPPDRYKGKGIRYAGETVKLKPGKGAKAI